MIYWILYCLFDGIEDAYFYHFKDVNKSTKINEHLVKLFKRVLTSFLVLIYINIQANGLNALELIKTLLALILVQPFIHNNAYYNFRHYLDNRVYKYGLTNQSKNSTAFLTKFETPVLRIIYLILGMICYII